MIIIVGLELSKILITFYLYRFDGIYNINNIYNNNNRRMLLLFKILCQGTVLLHIKDIAEYMEIIKYTSHFLR